MSLTQYNKKRNFSKTTEPEGKGKSLKDSLLFVIQKHDASSLHYDLRLEMESVLKSWAVPKGPSINPADKRLAMMVEDHPFDYKDFEGIIPEGNYGAGTVIVWDEGTYKPMDTEGLTKREQEKILLQQLRKGDVKITFNGSKIKGSFALVRIGKDDDSNSWLLIKKNDKFSKEIDITKKDKSIKTGKTLVQVAKENGAVLKHPPQKTSSKTATKKSAAKKTTPTKKSTPAKASKVATKTKVSTGKKKAPELINLLKAVKGSAIKSPMPKGIKPMLAVLTNESFDDKDWIFEIKWDGYRSLAFVEDGEADLMSRNNNSFSGRYKPVTDALQQLKLNAVFDGEIVAVVEKGLANFQMLQNWQKSPDTVLQYYIFDIIWLEGYDLTKIPLIERKKILQQILPADDDVIKFSDHIIKKGKDFFDVALNQGLEGIIAKKSSSVYQLNKRSEDWLKVKVNLRQEVIIAGFTEPRNSRKHFGALMLGVYKNSKLIYVGHTGSGFNQKSLQEIYDKLEPLITPKSPFDNTPKGNMPVTWVKPQLVCEIKFTEWTKDNIARHPIFMGIREDKKAKDVVLEKETDLAVAKKEKTESEKSVKTDSAKKQAATKKKSSVSKVAQQLTLADGKDQSIVLNKIELKLTNLNKPYWKKEGFKKIDLINYYLRMAPFIMPYILNRPHSLNRHPNGMASANFYQKNMTGKEPDWIVTHEDFSESTNKIVRYLVCANEATLIFMANLGCIEINPWHSVSKTWKNPDWSLLDIDPDDTNTFDEVIEVAQVTKKVLNAIGVEACVKTSGSSGIHIYIPLGAKYSYPQSKQLAELVFAMVHQELPELTSMERSPAKRKGKIYLDYLQNREIQTAAAPYSLRPKPGATVSTPLHWDEVKKGLHPSQFHINNIYERVQAEGDLFKPVLGKGIDLKKVLEKLQNL
ncbi:MAG: DNA ligase D [Flavisolibacter sp.]|nr:DNA ligase D [Flavisolibacter sp.]